MRTIYEVEIEENGRREIIEFEGPDGLGEPDIQRLADTHLRTARPGQSFSPSVYGGEVERGGQTAGQLLADSDNDQIPNWRDAGGLPMNRPAEWLLNQGVGAAQGAGHVFDNAAELLQGGYNQTLGRAFGPSTSATEANEAGQGFEGLADQLGPGGGIGRFAGEIGAAALLTRGLGGPVRQGAGAGALMSEADNPLEFGRDVVLGAAGGKAGDLISRGVQRFITPQIGAAAQRLHQRGVRMTPGQVFGGAAQRAEDRLTSRPFVGDQVVRGRQQSYEDFNRAALDEVVAPYNQSAASPIRIPRNASGTGAVRSVGDQLSNRYERLVPNLQLVPDEQLAADIQGLSATLASGDLSPAAMRRFETIIRNQVMSRLRTGGSSAPSGSRAVGPYTGGPARAPRGPEVISGQTYRQIERNLSRLISRFSRSQEPDNQALAEAFEQVQTAFQGALQRSNPRFAAELRGLNSSWANLVRVEGAAAGARGGLFSPLQFRSAVRRADDSTRGRAMARGEARMQQFADDAAEVLPPEYPDSGTAGRSQMSPFDPRYWLGAAQGLMYGPGTQQAITNAVMYPRPAAARTVADAFGYLPAPQMGATGTQILAAPFFGSVP
jgi:hypothetical protein